MKQTAVQWLVEQLIVIGQLQIPKGINVVTSIIEQTKQMEKQQMIDAYVEGGRKGFNEFADDYEQYYNETFKNS